MCGCSLLINVQMLELCVLWMGVGVSVGETRVWWKKHSAQHKSAPASATQWSSHTDVDTSTVRLSKVTIFAEQHELINILEQ
jgi:hypothetical protein